MMRLRRLLVLGLPACSAHPPTTEAPPPLRPEPSAIAPVELVTERGNRDAAVHVFDPKQCAVDQIPQSICGHYDETCEARSLHMSSTIWRDEFVNQFDTRDWMIDPATTEEWKRHQGDESSTACCLSVCYSIEVGDARPVPSKPTVPPDWRGNPMRLEDWCLPKPPRGTSAPSDQTPDCPRGVKLQGEWRPLVKFTDDECCYQGWVKQYNPGGRPARVEGVAQFAELERGEAWHTAIPPVGRDPARAAKWLAQARMEHASVAAFAATSLRLLALGAPAELVAGAHHAALDEIRHAQVAFALASAYAGTAVSAAGFEDAARMTTSVSLVELAVETFVDGCIGETIGALAAAQDADDEVEPRLASLFREIAKDEARHAELAWLIVSWCVQREPAIIKLLAVMLGSRCSRMLVI